jgi:hypothetical protein
MTTADDTTNLHSAATSETSHAESTSTATSKVDSMTEAIKAGFEVFQGKTEKLPDLLQHGGTAAITRLKNLTPIQKIAAITILSLGVALLTKKMTEDKR